MCIPYDGQITLYLDSCIKGSKELHVVCETFTSKHKCLKMKKKNNNDIRES